MADIAVGFVLDKLSVVFQEKLKLVAEVEEDIEYVRRELQQMMAFHRGVDAMELIDPEIQEWAKQVQEMANDIEDAIDEFMIHFSSTHTFCFSLTKLKLKSAIASQVKTIIARVKSVAEMHQRYRLKFISVSEQGSTPIFPNNVLLLEEAELVGIDRPKQQLIARLREDDPRLKVISVVGMAGLGKTTLVRKVYDDPKVKTRFHIQAWLTVFRFTVEELLADLIHQLYHRIKQPPPKALGNMNRNSLAEIIKDMLCKCRYMIVLDDVWSAQDREAIQSALPNKNNGSRIILTTSLIDVASFSSEENNGCIYHLNPLSEEDSRVLFHEKTFQGGKCPPDLVEISKTILKRCGGMPLAIVSIGRALAPLNPMNINGWRMFSQSLGAELEDNQKLANLKIILSLSLNSLPYYLKPCFLFLSIFPEDYLIERNTLIRLWITEGFVKEKQGSSLEEVAEEYLNELINCSLINVVKANDDGTMKRGRIHDLYREIILSRSRVQNFVSTTSLHTTMWCERARRLSVHGTLENAQTKRLSTKLHSLFAFNVEDSPSISSILHLLSSNRMLKVVNLRGLPIETFPEEILGLCHLTYLSLRGTRLKMLPGSIKKLKNLEVLDLKHTFIATLPVEILKLQNLRHLLAYRHVQGPYIPYESTIGFKALNGIGKLTSLQELGFIEVSQYAGKIFKEIEKMKDLRRLIITKLRKEQGMAVCSTVNKLEKLSSLGLHSVNYYEILDLAHLSTPPPYLQRLYLRGRLTEMPQWIQSLRSLVKVKLQWSRLSNDPLKYLEDLPKLAHLEILVGFIGETLCFEVGKFQSLKVLHLDNLEALRWVIIKEGATPYLEKLIIKRCNLLQSVPWGIEGLTRLQILEFFDMPAEFIIKLMDRDASSDYLRVKDIPEVYYNYWTDGSWEVHSLEAKQEDTKVVDRRLHWL